MNRLAALLLPGPALAAADRITAMHEPEFCAYKAKLSVAAYFYVLQGKPRAEVKLHWLTGTGRRTRSISLAAKRDRSPEQAFGDRAYKACTSVENT